MDENEIDEVILEGAEAVLKGWRANQSGIRLRRLVTLGILTEKAFGLPSDNTTPHDPSELERRVLRLVKS